MEKEESFDHLVSHIAQKEKEAAMLEEQVKRLKKDEIGDISSVIPQEIINLRNENERLKYRINILKRNIAAEEAKRDSYMINIQQYLNVIFRAAITTAFPELNDPPVNISAIPFCNQAKFGDYQCTSAMALAKMLKNSDTKLSSLAIAEKIVNCLPNDEPLFEQVSFVPPGFINIRINPTFIGNEIAKLLQNGVKPPLIKKLRVVIDFSSPNIAKEMHVGHLRSTVIGESIARLLEFCGHDVLRLNHVGDWGTQFGMLIAQYLETFKEDDEPTISDLLKIYKESKKRFDEDEEFKKHAYSLVVLLQQHDPKIYALWEKICEISRKEYQRIYERLDVTITERGESFYHALMPQVIEELDAKGLLTKEEGRILMFCPGYSVPMTLVKSDGGYTYDTSDMATIKHRIFEEKADWIIYVVDSGQALHLNLVFAGAELAGWLDKSKVRVDHVGFGVVLGEDKKKFKTRSGETVRLVDLLDEGMERALAKLKEKERDKVLTQDELKAAQEAVAYGCIKYADLSHSRTNDYIFSFDRMLSDKGNTAVYLLYVVTRIRSIARNANISQEDLRKYASSHSIILADAKEINLGKTILMFPEIILEIAESLQLHLLCDYLYNLSGIFTEFYDSCYCIEKDKETGNIVKVDFTRLVLCEATALIMEKGMHILGLKTVGKM